MLVVAPGCALLVSPGAPEEVDLPALGPDGDEVDDPERLGAALALAEEGAAEGPPRIGEVAASATMGAAGYITVEVEPWASKRPIGRLTVWPADKPPERQSAACRCYMHPNCSFSRKRLQVDDSRFLHWLFSMQPLPIGASVAEKAAAKAEHAALARTMLAAAPRPAEP